MRIHLLLLLCLILSDLGEVGGAGGRGGEAVVATFPTRGDGGHTWMGWPELAQECQV